MKLFKKIRTFLFLSFEMKLLLIEAYILLGYARVLKSVSFSKVTPLLGENWNETSLEMDDSNKKILKNVSDAVDIMSRYTLWESMCLVKAIAAMKMLEKRKIESTIYFGTAKDDSGKLIAHAWLRSGPYYITGADVMNRFVVVSKFAKKIHK
ncbi:lasso peptide biosynthesis B2 protein [Mesobacillus foraminis]|uniref:lasso peptide biosynthesis B2 protein n=1 Tax=Mesobacillus foraminis TaxID=279826 RepID=UPI001BEC15BB|nr:lasso peptide biosynthesis B2 protein [Mesobacillus foraminis]MBT2758427.1 lasso peptide biosynthesis B2 protein [Mesobacillus foraminis]